MTEVEALMAIARRLEWINYGLKWVVLAIAATAVYRAFIPLIFSGKR